MSFSIPVILIIFRRPELTFQVFQAIRSIQPTKLLIVADGPRNESEKEACLQARAVTENIDWSCEALRNYSNVNLGCRNRVSSGLTWAFEQVESAIILEDDCLPHSSFFRYCETLLNYYHDDERLMVISGSNFQNGQQRTSHSYYFSKYNHCWGWATWRRAWQHWEYCPEKWLSFRDSGLLHSVCSDPCEAKYWRNVFDAFFLIGEPDSWAYAWTFSCWSQNGLTALPNVNLVSNIGFGVGATHTVAEHPHACLATDDIGSIEHPPFIVCHHEADRYTFDHHFGGKALKGYLRWKNYFRQRLKRIFKFFLSSLNVREN